ncbi:MAG: AIR synthase-related protein [Eggerthella lenta]
MPRPRATLRTATRSAAAGQVNELYHPGYAAKRMEIGAVVGATPADHVRRETPAPGDVVVLLGGRTGDGIGGATGSSKAHKLESLESCGAEVQKRQRARGAQDSAPVPSGDACKLIKRCNDFGAGSVSVAIGELADGLFIDLNKVPKKYDGLDGTELAISESQERMAVALAAEDVDEFIGYAHEENLEATPIATVTEEARVRMVERRRHRGREPRLLNSNGAAKHQDVRVLPGGTYERTWAGDTLAERMNALVTDLNVCSNKARRALRLHHRRGHGAHAVRRVAPADAGDGHGGEAARVRRDLHGERHGLGLQPVPHGGEPVHGLVHRRGGERGEAGGRRFRARGHVPDVPGVFREAARRARALGQARRRRAGRADGAGGPGYRLHRRQGLHVGQFRAAGRAAHAGVVRHGHRLGGSRDVARVQAGGSRVVRIAPASYDGVTPDAAGLVEAFELVERLTATVRRWPCPRRDTARRLRLCSR